jgi:hypothetical protein
MTVSFQRGYRIPAGMAGATLALMHQFYDAPI